MFKLNEAISVDVIMDAYARRGSRSPPPPPILAGGIMAIDKSSNILIVDDDYFSLELCKTLFESNGYKNIYLADSYASAMHILKAMFIALLLTDIMMPGITGAQLALYVQDYAPDTKIIFMSASPEILKGSKERNIVCYKKPLHFCDIEKELS